MYNKEVTVAVFLPTYVTSISQPLDQGVIKMVKKNRSRCYKSGKEKYKLH